MTSSKGSQDGKASQRIRCKLSKREIKNACEQEKALRGGLEQEWGNENIKGRPSPSSISGWEGKLGTMGKNHQFIGEPGQKEQPLRMAKRG